MIAVIFLIVVLSKKKVVPFNANVKYFKCFNGLSTFLKCKNCIRQRGPKH